MIVRIKHISPLGFGTLTLGPYQKNFSVKYGAGLIAHAIRRGVNVIDTADLYMTYPYIRQALKEIDSSIKKNLIIMSRSYNYTYNGMAKSFNKACAEMGIERIPVFMLHEMESEHTLKGHDPALRYLLEMKERGKIDLTGISTHYIRAVMAAAEHPDIDCIFAILNKNGLGIMDGNREEMKSALKHAHDMGKIIFAMKAIGGGHFFREAEESLAYVRDLPFVDCVVVGMQSVEEIEENVRIMDDGCRKLEAGRRRRWYRKTQKIPVIESRYLTTEITEGTEDTEISMFSLRLPSANLAISELRTHFFDSLGSDDGNRHVTRVFKPAINPNSLKIPESMQDMAESKKRKPTDISSSSLPLPPFFLLPSPFPLPLSLFPLPLSPFLVSPFHPLHVIQTLFPLNLSHGIRIFFPTNLFELCVLCSLCDLCGSFTPHNLYALHADNIPPHNEDRKLLIEDYCRGCGECERACPFGAIKVVEGKARVDHDKCMLCSYCAYKCPDFCIKVV